MRTNQPGLTLVELLIVSVLAALTLAAVYETLIVQEKTYAASGAMIQDQETLRTALGILESELREVGSIGGDEIGGTDFAIASADSVVIRAQRKLGAVCKFSRGENWILTWSLGDAFAVGDRLLVFVDNDTLTSGDDQWRDVAVTNISSSTDSECASQWDVPLQFVKLDNANMEGIWEGAPVRSYDWVTYSLYQFGHLGWGLGRRTGDGPPRYLVAGLAPPPEGLHFEYFKPDGSATTQTDAIARLRITLTTDPRDGSGVDPTTLSTNLYLRNN